MHHRRDTWRRPCRACCRTGTGRLERRQAFAPDAHDAVDVGLRAGPDLEAGMMRLEVHRQRRAQIGEAGMHLAADRAAMRARGARRSAAGRRRAAISLRYSAIASVSQTLMPSWVRQGTRNEGDSSSSSARVDGSSLGDRQLVEIEPGQLAQQPAAQRPGAVILAGDGEGQPWPWRCSSRPGAALVPGSNWQLDLAQVCAINTLPASAIRIVARRIDRRGGRQPWRRFVSRTAT